MHRPGKHALRAAGLITAASLTVLPLTVSTTAAARTALSRRPATARTALVPAQAPAGLALGGLALGGLTLRRLLPGAGSGDSWRAAGIVPFPGLPRLAASSAGPTYDLQTGQVPIRGGGHTWDLSAEVLTGARGPALAEIDITTPRRHGIEDHSWLFQDMPSRDASVNPATHRVSVGSRSDLSPFARLSLAFRPTSHTTATCANSDFAGTKYVGQVTGTVRLVTGLDGVTFSRAHVSFGRSSSLEVTRRLCRVTPCTFDGWALASQARPNVTALGIQIGRPGHEQFIAGLAKLTVLSRARDIDRTDEADMTTATPAFSLRRRRLVISTSRAGVITGSAVIRRAVLEGAEPGDCTVGRTPYRVNANVYTGRFVSPAGKRIVTHMFLSPLWMRRSGLGGFDIVTSVRRQK